MQWRAGGFGSAAPPRMEGADYVHGDAQGPYADAGHYAAWLAKASRVVAIAEFMGRPVSRCFGGHDAAAAQEGLRLAGVEAANDGTVSLESNAAKEYAASAWQQDQPISELGQFKLELRGARRSLPRLGCRAGSCRASTGTWMPSKRLRCGTVPRPRSRG